MRPPRSSEILAHVSDGPARIRFSVALLGGLRCCSLVARAGTRVTVFSAGWQQPGRVPAADARRACGTAGRYGESRVVRARQRRRDVALPTAGMRIRQGARRVRGTVTARRLLESIDMHSDARGLDRRERRRAPGQPAPAYRRPAPACVPCVTLRVTPLGVSVGDGRDRSPRRLRESRPLGNGRERSARGSNPPLSAVVAFGVGHPPASCRDPLEHDQRRA
jgi:hypothetical protein